MTAPAQTRARLDRDAIVAAALRLLEVQGLEGVTTRSLAAALGVKGPSLYWHLGSKSELIDLMADAILEGALPPQEPTVSWRDWMADGARAIRQAALSHRDGARLIAAARPSEQRRARFADNIARLEAAGFTREGASAAFIALSRYALGSALGEQLGGFGPAQEQRLFDQGLEALLDGMAHRLAPAV